MRCLQKYKFSCHIPALRCFLLSKVLCILEGNGNSDVLISLVIEEDLRGKGRNIASQKLDNLLQNSSSLNSSPELLYVDHQIALEVPGYQRPFLWIVCRVI